MTVVSYLDLAKLAMDASQKRQVYEAIKQQHEEAAEAMSAALRRYEQVSQARQQAFDAMTDAEIAVEAYKEAMHGA